MKKIEDRVFADMDFYYEQAKKIIIENRVFLESLAKRLQQKDVLVQSEIKEIKEKSTACN